MAAVENVNRKSFEESKTPNSEQSGEKFDSDPILVESCWFSSDCVNASSSDSWRHPNSFSRLLGKDINKSLSETSTDAEILRWRKDYNEISYDISSIQGPSLSTLILRANLCQLIHFLGSAVTGCGHVIVNIPLSILHGFFSPFLLAQRVSFSFLRSFQKCVCERGSQVRRLVDRIKSTLRGSVDDIGWLAKIPELPPVRDRTDRFVQLLGLVSNGIHKLPNSYVYLLVPGLFSNHGPLYFVDTKKYFSKLGVACHIAKIHSEASVETNALEIKNYIEELYWGCGKRVMLLGHSKGGVDAAAAIAKYWSNLKEKVAGLVVVQSPYAGSPIASDIFREGQIADVETRRVMEVIICKIIKGDIRALEDLTYDKRREFLARYPLPIDFPTVSFHTEVSIAPGVISTMSHIAHAELPWLPLSAIYGADFQEPMPATKLPVIIPMAAAMALSALHLDLRYGEKSDGLVVRKDAEIPGSVVVRPDRKFDHAWMVYSQSKKGAHESDASQMCEALLTLLLEEAQLDPSEDEN